VELPARHRPRFENRLPDGKGYECTKRFIVRAHVRIAVAVFLLICLDPPRANLTASLDLSYSLGFTIYSRWIAELTARPRRETDIATRFDLDWQRICFVPAVAHELLQITQAALVNVRKISETNNALIRSRAAGPTSLRGPLCGEPSVEAKPGLGACLEIALLRGACG
jgi:hypothetical protein